jgi:hypothetical protein
VSADWWTEDRRDQLIGHGIRWGTKWSHITAILDAGPGANSVRPLCGGIQSVCHIDSSLDLENQAECEDWKHQGIRFPLNCRIEDVITKPNRLASICPKCRTIYDRRTQP